MDYRSLYVRGKQPVWQTTKRQSLQSYEVRIQVVAAGINRADLAQIVGRYKPPQDVTEVLGLECSGYILGVGSAVSHWQEGDEVCALLQGGGLAQEVICHHSLVLPVPKGVTLVESAAIPEVFATAWHNIYSLGGVKRRDRILLYGAGGGVGTAAIQLARIFDNPLVGTVSSQSKVDFCRRLGALHVFNRERKIFDLLRDLGPYDLILDPVGGCALRASQQLLARQGRLVIIGVMGGRIGELDLGHLLMKRQRIIGSVLRTLPLVERAQVIEALRKRVWPLFEHAKIRPVVDQVVFQNEVLSAYGRMQHNLNMGKILVQISQD